MPCGVCLAPPHHFVVPSPYKQGESAVRINYHVISKTNHYTLCPFAPLRDRRIRPHPPSAHAKSQRGAKFYLPIRYPSTMQGKAHKQQNSLRHFAPLRDKRIRPHQPSSHAKPQRGAKFCLPSCYPSTIQGKAHKQQNSLRPFAPLRDRRIKPHPPSSHAKPQRGAKFCLPSCYPSTIRGNHYPKNAPPKCNNFSPSNTPDNQHLRLPQNY